MTGRLACSYLSLHALENQSVTRPLLLHGLSLGFACGAISTSDLLGTSSLSREIVLVEVSNESLGMGGSDMKICGG